MDKIKTIVLTVLLFIAFDSIFGPAYTQQCVCTGKPVEVFADPSDFVVALDVDELKTNCRSVFFHIQRSNDNFKELAAVVLTAVGTGKYITFWQSPGSEGCVLKIDPGRNKVDHGSIPVLYSGPTQCIGPPQCFFWAP
jgi:hypothetical protein